MPKYRVIVQTTERYQVEVDAEDEDDAEVLAMGIPIDQQKANSLGDSDMEVEDIECIEGCDDEN